MIRGERNQRCETVADTRFLTFGCYRRLPLLETEWARDTVVSYLAHSKSRLGYELFAYVVMPDHVHLLLHPEVETATVRRILSALKTRTASVTLDRLRAENAVLIARVPRLFGKTHPNQASSAESVSFRTAVHRKPATLRHGCPEGNGES